MNNNGIDLLNVNQQFADLVFLALDHGIESIRNGGPLVPFIIYEGNNGRELHRFAEQRLEVSEQQARLAAAALPECVEWCVLAYDGSVTVDHTKYDAIIVEAAIRGKPRGTKLAQRYTPKKKFFGAFRTIGNALSLGECDSFFRSHE